MSGAAIAVLWRPYQCRAIGPQHGALLAPLSQKTYAEALHSPIALVQPPYWQILADPDISALDAAGEKHAAAQSAPLAQRDDFDRAHHWHDGREAAYVAAASSILLDQLRPASVIIAAAPEEPEAQALIDLCNRASVSYTIVPADLGHQAYEPAPPFFEDVHWHGFGARRWAVVLCTGQVHLSYYVARIRADGFCVALAYDPIHSGDSTALLSLAKNDPDVRLFDVAEGLCFGDRSDNTTYGAIVRTRLARLFEQAPALCVLTNIRRPETVIAARLARDQRTPLLFLPHSGGRPIGPYRFSTTELGAGARRVGWTRSADVDIVAPPPAIRPDPVRRAARLALRMGRIGKQMSVGLVVTTDELFAAPEVAIGPIFEALTRLMSNNQHVLWRIRLRKLEDREAVWRAALPAQVSLCFENQHDRPFVPFARACDLLIEIGSESSAFFEAASNAVPYVRLGPPPAHRQRFSRPLGLVPELDMTNPGTQFASLQDNAVSRARLALRQLTWLEHATRPQNFDGAFLFAS